MCIRFSISFRSTSRLDLPSSVVILHAAEASTGLSVPASRAHNTCPSLHIDTDSLVSRHVCSEEHQVDRHYFPTAGRSFFVGIDCRLRSLQVVATSFVRKLMEKIFTHEELYWLDDVLPGTKVGRIRRTSIPRHVNMPKSADESSPTCADGNHRVLETDLPHIDEVRRMIFRRPLDYYCMCYLIFLHCPSSSRCHNNLLTRVID